MVNRVITILFTLFTTLLLTSCLVIPVDYYREGFRRNINYKTQDLISVNEFSREEVIILLGEPDQYSADGTEMWYETEKVSAWIIIGDQGGEIHTHYYLILHFDNKGILKEVKFTTGSSSI